ADPACAAGGLRVDDRRLRDACGGAAALLVRSAAADLTERLVCLEGEHPQQDGENQKSGIETKPADHHAGDDRDPEGDLDPAGTEKRIDQLPAIEGEYRQEIQDRPGDAHPTEIFEKRENPFIEWKAVDEHMGDQ